MAGLHTQGEEGKEEGLGCPKSLSTEIHLLRPGNQDFAHLVPEGPG